MSAERPGRPRAAQNPTGWSFVLLVGLAAWLRFRGLSWGEPYVYHADEHYVLDAALRMVREGTPDPGFFQYPSLLLYLQAALVVLLQPWVATDLGVDRAVQGLGPWDVATPHFPWILAGRGAVALLGTVSVLLLSWLWRRWFGLVPAVVSAVLLAVSPLHVEHSHYLTTDVPAMLWVLLALAWSAEGKDHIGSVALAGVCAGLAASTKYSAGVVWFVVLAGAVCNRRPVAAVLVSLVSFVAAFALTSPFVVLHPQRAWADLAIVRYNYASGPWSPWNFWFYLTYLWHTALGPVGSILAVAGAIALVCRRDLGHRWWRGAVVVVPWLYVMYLSTWSVRFERNLMPVLPFALLYVGLAVARVERIVGGWRARVLGAALVALVAWAPLRQSEQIVERSMLPDTRTLALHWIVDHVPAGAHIAREEYTPQLQGQPYRVTFVQVLGTRPYSWYLSEGVEYLVASSLIYERYRHRPELFSFYQFLFERLPLVAEFQPGPGVAGPTIRIYEIPRWQEQ